MIGEHLFLFDNQLGIPLPADGGSRIATLADLKKNPGLLDDLSLDDQPYRTTPADLEHVVALVDACHCAMSQRMMILEKNLADLEAAKPREERTDAEQTRIFNLHAQRQQMSEAYTNSMQRLSIELPEMRERFLQRGFLDVVLQFKAAGLDPAQLTVSRIDTAQLTDTYQGIAMRGGPMTLWFAQGKTPLNITLTLVVAKVPHHGWVFVQDPKLNVPAVQGPAEPPPSK